MEVEKLFVLAVLAAFFFSSCWSKSSPSLEQECGIPLFEVSLSGFGEWASMEATAPL